MRGFRFAVWLVCFGASALAGEPQSTDADYDKALALYTRTQYQSATQVLQSVDKKDGRTLELLGKSFYMLGNYKDATDTLKKATELEPGNSSHFHWLGRAFGRRAETAFPVAAPGYATKARANFEKAVELDPNNAEALNDLFEYYLQAPSLLGGGLDKAARLAERIQQHNPAEGAFAKARIAEEKKDWIQAEAQLRKASELAPDQPGRLVDLAKLLAKRGRFDESDATFAKARQLAPGAPTVVFAEAATYIHANRKPDQARELLKKYLAMNISPEDPSKSEARKLLSKVP